jgi:hypothetical protein
MKFQILRLIIWPKADRFAPQVIPFEPGMVNVITGSSRSGKSAIIPIIDYCLASSDCYIPIDTIRDHTSWYGVIVETASEQLLIARRVPIGPKVSNEYYVSRGTLVSIPEKIMGSNETNERVKFILNTLTSVPSFRLAAQDDPRPYQERLGFRDLMALVFQSQDIVANQNILFYKTHAHEHRERLRNWFPYILGAESIEVLAARQRLETVQKRLTQLNKEIDRVKKVSNSWMANMTGNLQLAQEYGLFADDVSKIKTPEGLLLAAKLVVEATPDYPKVTLDELQKASDAVLQLEKEDESLSDEISYLKKRLDDVRRLKIGLIDYGDVSRKRAERLQISQWLEEIALDVKGCPLCGSDEHNDSRTELTKISDAFRVAENEVIRTAEIPTSFAREEAAIKSQLEGSLAKRKALNKRLDMALKHDKHAQMHFQRRKNFFMFIGHFKAFLETFQSLAEGGDFDDEMSTLENEKIALSKILDPNGVKRRIDFALDKIMQRVLKRLNTLDVEEKYRQVAPNFSIKDLNLSVPSNDGHWHFLAEVGSASNWVSFHLALMCALQEYFQKDTESCVPSFVIFDQPSQVYFPKLKHDVGKDQDPKYEDEDVDAVKNIFTTLAKSVLESKGAWQCIVLDHADEGIYGGIDGVHEVQVWRNGKKLIPVEWYS